MHRELRGMVVVITGASAGIGKALAEALSPRGVRLVLAARRADRLEELNQALGGQHLCVTTDVAKQEDCENLIRSAHQHFGRIDTLVCNAGYGVLRAIGAGDSAEVERQFRTNVFGTLDCIRPALPIFEQQTTRDGYRGQIMIVSSAVARRGLPYFGVYSATKSAQLSIAEATRVEVKPKQIAVTSVHPIGTDTEFSEVYQREANNRVRMNSTKAEVRQTAEKVAKAMVKGIEKPHAEVWPFRPSRWAIGLGTLMPRLVDRVLSKRGPETPV